jgi:hypothetical protein
MQEVWGAAGGDDDCISLGDWLMALEGNFEEEV